MDMIGMIAAIDLLRKEQERRMREHEEVKRFFKAAERHSNRQRKRDEIDSAFYELGFSKVPYRSGRVPNGGVVFEPRKGAALVFNSYHEAEQWLKRAGVYK